MPTIEEDKGSGTPSNVDEQSTSDQSRINGSNMERTIINMVLDEGFESIALKHSLPPQNDIRSKPLCQQKMEESRSMPPTNVRRELIDSHIKTRGVSGSPVQTNLCISLSAPLGNKNVSGGTSIDEGQMGKMITSFVPKPPKYTFARPPAEGRMNSQLLPRYWPRITDQELQQISGNTNSSIVPLFEKVLSASDAGRIGRLVLPKACAEAYFPPVSQPEGLPIRIQDTKGKEWVFQFRFWPNNNSRMYVLEGVTPCIQSMQLQAGDTVIFSRMDPEGKILLGFRKTSSETFFSALAKNVPLTSGSSGMLQSFSGSRELVTSSKHLSSVDVNWYLPSNIGNKNGEGPHSLSLMTPDCKRSQNLGSKSKRLLIDRQDAFELKLSWEDMQDMLRPPLSARVTTVKIEDYEFEEYEEPPAFAKRSIFTVRLSGELEQWAQCDICFKWRRLPADYLLPPQWRCQENAWDLCRCSCSAPDELAPQELEFLLNMDKERKKQSNEMNHKSLNTEEVNSDMADAQVNVSGSRDEEQEGGSSIAKTTKHPRHHPGCSCIVCIQPPSGKGKHEPSCLCNVCMTVKRRFKTLMMRKKKRQLEREAELAHRDQYMWGAGKEDKAEVKNTIIPGQVKLQPSSHQLCRTSETGKALLDLNCHPSEEAVADASPHVSMLCLLQQASLSLQNYLKQSGLTSLASEQQGSSVRLQAVPQNHGEIEVQVHEDRCIPTSSSRTRE
ncbi:unnamed protein product [Cuscuta campestris]|uniref:TF-B3 domain-containing protein n=1 Tax=Cuscuta campestris TaxID=132261 RepID=A0A484KYX0_9ASTE|nr:unnamed protein product [Cuscuta campestris]